MLQIDVIVVVIVAEIVAEIVAMILVVIVFLHLNFRATRWGKERWLYPPSGWIRRIKELDLP
jgi:hypothetical protein